MSALEATAMCRGADHDGCGGLCQAMRRRTNAAAGHALPAFLGACLLIVVAWVVTHIDGLLQLLGGLTAFLVAVYCVARWGVPALVRRAYRQHELPPRPIYYALPRDRRAQYRRQLPRGQAQGADVIRVIAPEEWRDFYENHR